MTAIRSTMRGHRSATVTADRQKSDAVTPAAREKSVKRLARTIATSPHFSTDAAYEDFVVNRRAK
jgi:hypothetical protein